MFREDPCRFRRVFEVLFAVKSGPIEGFGGGSGDFGPRLRGPRPPHEERNEAERNKEFQEGPQHRFRIARNSSLFCAVVIDPS